MNSLNLSPRYYFQPNKSIIGVSIFIVLIIGVLIRYLFFVTQWYYILPILLGIGVFIHSFLRAPFYTKISDDTVLIKRFIGHTQLNKVTKVEKITKKEILGTIRTFGNGGFFGYTGYHWSPEFGRYYLIAVNLNELAKVTLASGRIYVINYPAKLLTA